MANGLMHIRYQNPDAMVLTEADLQATVINKQRSCSASKQQSFVGDEGVLVGLRVGYPAITQASRRI